VIKSECGSAKAIIRLVENWIAMTSEKDILRDKFLDMYFFGVMENIFILMLADSEKSLKKTYSSFTNMCPRLKNVEIPPITKLLKECTSDDSKKIAIVPNKFHDFAKEKGSNFSAIHMEQLTKMFLSDMLKEDALFNSVFGKASPGQIINAIDPKNKGVSEEKRSQLTKIISDKKIGGNAMQKFVETSNNPDADPLDWLNAVEPISDSLSF